MSYFVVVPSTSQRRSEDYEGIYQDFAALGLSRTLQLARKCCETPTTTTAGEFNGQVSALSGITLRQTQAVLRSPPFERGNFRLRRRDWLGTSRP